MSCRKNELGINGEGKKYAQWCRVIKGISGKASGHCNLLGKLIAYINVG
jgi:hypothetical protein